MPSYEHLKNYSRRVTTTCPQTVSYPKSENLQRFKKAPKFWLFTTDNKEHVFSSIKRVLLKLGLEKTEVDTSSTSSMHYDWDFLWSFEYFSLIPLNFSALQQHHRLNHIPGNIHFISKSILMTNTDSKYVAKGFTDEKALKAFAEKNPNVRYVQKHSTNRGVSMKNATELQITATIQKHGFFAQVFVEDPLLIFGHKFDFNVYVVITSVDPLQVYYYEKNFLFRFCNLPYDSNNFTDARTYVIDSTHITESKFPEMQKYLNHSYSYKDSFNAIMRKMGHDTQVILDQVEDCIRTALMSKEHLMVQEIKRLKAKYGKLHFVEMFRFDFLIDAKLNVHLMEINMSPNMEAAAKFVNNRHLYESVAYSFLNLVGVGSYLDNSKVHSFADGERGFLCNVDTTSVNPDVCADGPCEDTCDLPECELCWKCISMRLQWDIMITYLEHLNIGEMKRVVPPSFEILQKADDTYWNSLSPTNKLFTKWMIAMCKKNKRFC